MTNYLMKGTDDLEKILETLKDHFQLIRLTSFEELARNNTENKSAKELLDHSNNELRQLAKQLDLLQMDEEDVRYDVFQMIYEMLFDNIELRVKQNKLSGRVLSQSQLNIEKTVANFFRKNHTTISGASQLRTVRFQAKLLEAKNKGRAPKTDTRGATPGGKADSDSLAASGLDSEEDEYGSEEEMERFS